MESSFNHLLRVSHALLVRCILRNNFIVYSLTSTCSLCRICESLGKVSSHLRRAVRTTDDMTSAAPINEYRFGASLKKIICQRKAKTMSELRASATGPACSTCKASVSNIWPRKLKTPNATTSNRSVPHAGRHSS